MVSDIRRCPLGLDDNRKLCSVGSCDACMAERTEFFGYETRHRRKTVSNTDPDHYKHSKIEAIDYIRDTMGHEGYIYYCEGATKKYLHRFRYKGQPLEDLKKAQVYLGWMIEAYEEREREEHEYELSLLRQE